MFVKLFAWSKKIAGKSHQEKKADFVSVGHEKKPIGLPHQFLSLKSIAKFLNVQESGLHLKCIANGKTETF